MENRRFEGERKEPEIVYSRAVKAGKRIYYLDVKRARNNDLYLCITESKRTGSGFEDSPIQIEKHRIFLYKEDFSHFTEGLNDVIGFVARELGDIEERQQYDHEDVKTEAPVVEEKVEKEKGFFSLFKK